MQSLFNKILLTIIVGFLCSCNTQKVAYTSDIQSNYRFSEEKLKTIQFYTSEQIILYVTSNNDRTNIHDGKITISESQVVDRIIIPANTPCVLEKKLNDNTFLLSFEKNKVLCFSNTGNVYSIAASIWTDNEGLVKYGDKNYFTMSRSTFLTIKMKKLNSIISKERTLSGRTL